MGLMDRLALSDGAWERIAPLIIGRPDQKGSTGRDNRVKSDRIDGEALVRTLMAWIRGEPRVCSMVRVPTVEDEDRRRIDRERKRHVNRIKGLLFRVGARGYEPMRRDRRKRLKELQTGADLPLPAHLKLPIGRELDRAGTAERTDQGR